jgi:hypothetical protein
MTEVHVRSFAAGCLALLCVASWAKAAPAPTAPVLFRTLPVDGLSIFYREAGPANAPTLLLLHGFPSSSRMYEPLFARLADQYHLIAPDYPVSAIAMRRMPRPSTTRSTISPT